MVDECIVLAESPGALVKLCGISVLERLLRSLERCGFKRAVILSSAPDVISQDLAQSSWPRAQLDVTVRSRGTGAITVEQVLDIWPQGAELLLVVRGDTVFDDRLLRTLATQKKQTALVDSAAPPPLQPLVASVPKSIRGKFCGAAIVHSDWAWRQNGPLEEILGNALEHGDFAPLDAAAQPLYSVTMRREVRPFWFPAPPPANQKLAEQLLVNSAQKGALDFPAWVHAPLENFLISHLCKTSITPNQLTLFCNMVAWAATILFATGHLIWGTALALIVGVLDGLDGKQARIKVETSKSGKLEHWLDGLFEISWWTALAYHFQSSGELPQAYYYLFLLLLAEAVDAIAKGSILLTYRKLIDELGPFDRVVRFVGGRRNIYVWILAVGILLAVPAKAFITMAWWEVVTAAVHIPRAAWALWAFRKSCRGIR